jgi:hypothetical protein
VPHPQNPFIQLSKSPVDESSCRFPKRGPYEEMTISRAFSTYPSGSPARKLSLQVPFTELPHRETLHLQHPFQPYLTYLKVPGR